MRGSLKRLGKNRWRLTFDLPMKGEKRKQRVLTFHGNQRDAERELAKRIEEARGGYTGSRDTLGAFLDGWIASRTCAENTRKSLENQAKYVLPRLGLLRLESVSPLHLQQLYADLLSRGKMKQHKGSGLKASSVARVHAFLKMALGDATRMGLIPFNPAERVRAPHAEHNTPRFLTPDEAKDLLDKLQGTEWWFLVLLASVTGCRLGELLALERGDFHLRESFILVARSIDTFGNVKLPKNGKPRVVPLPPELIPIIEEHLPTKGALFPQLSENSMSTSARFIYVCKKLGYEGVHFHTLRHTVGSILMARGVHPKAIQQLLGHHAVSYTMEVYSHLMPGAFADTTRPLSDLVRDRSVIKGEVDDAKTPIK